jgi:cyclohexa-1,5-dienecarbonyl-CoA hydratase
MAEPFRKILFEEEPGVVTLTIHTPPMNLMDLETLGELREGLQRAQRIEALKVLVLTGAGDQAFSAGVSMDSFTPERIQGFLDIAHTTLGALEELDLVTIAAVKGVALGGGCELALACDFVFAAEGAQFGQPDIKFGMFAPVASALFPRLIGVRKTLELLLTGEIFSVERALELGLINAIYPAGELDRAVTRFVGRLNKMSAPVLRLARRAVYLSADVPMRTALERTRHLYLHELMATEDAHEGIASFLEGRRPRWKDR